MKKNKIKYVLIPAFAAATLFPVLANDNQAKDNEDKTTAPSNVSNTVSTSEKTTAVNSTDNNATNNAVVTPSTSSASPVNAVAPTSSNNESTNSASVENKEVAKPTIPFTVAEYKQKSALELAKLIREKKVVNTNSTKLDPSPKTLPNTGESTNNFLSAIGLSFLALIGLLKRKNNN